jgi:hypothetical protein
VSITRVEHRTTLGDIGRGMLRLLCLVVTAVAFLWVLREPISAERVEGIVVWATILLVVVNTARLNRVLACVVGRKNGTDGADGTDGGGCDPK